MRNLNSKFIDLYRYIHIIKCIGQEKKKATNMGVKVTTKRIVNPEKWLGKSVLHCANSRDFQYTETYFICEETGVLCLHSQEAYYGDTFASYEEACAAGYDECYSYSEKGLYQMWKRAYKKGKVA